jgi:hypothetical protein
VYLQPSRKERHDAAMAYPRRSCSRTDFRSSYLSNWFMPGSPRQALNAGSPADTQPSLPGCGSRTPVGARSRDVPRQDHVDPQPLAGQRERSGGLRTCRRRSLLLLFRGWFAGERRRCWRQDFPLSIKPMLIGLAMHAAICAPDLVGALANAVFQALIHLTVLPTNDGASLISQHR